jgi:hypothetical protein
VKSGARRARPGSTGRLSEIEEKLVRKGMLRKDEAWYNGLREKTRGREWGVRVGSWMQVGSRTEGERLEASGKGTRSSSHEPLAPDRPKAVIQFTGGTI